MLASHAIRRSERRRRRVVVVLGGNAFVTPGERLTMSGQLQFAHDALAQLVPLFDDDTEVLLSHGNGPQVGHMLTRVEQALGKAYALPLEVCVAESEGELGYVLQQALVNVLSALGRSRPSAVLLSQVVVAPDDPAFLDPSKPIGVFHDAAEAEQLSRQGFAMREDAGRGWRRVVPSPRPVEVLERDVIRGLLAQNVIVIAAGGGGIPVVRRDGRLVGVEAVIDKDLTGALLADQLDADELIILTDVPCAYRDFRSPSQSPLARLDPDEARRLSAEGHFAAGSMGPKIEACVQFANRAGRRALITNPSSLAATLRGEAGTVVTCDSAMRVSTDVGAEPAPSSSLQPPAPSQRPRSPEPARAPYVPRARATPLNCLILGAAGRDFHDFQTFFRDRSDFRVRGFTAAQIPFIEQREFPASLTGPAYAHALPIFSESRLPELIRELDIDFCFLAYSDLSHAEVMHKASLVQACGAGFALLGPRHTQYVAGRPVVSVTAVRTGAGKSPLSQWLARELTATGLRVGILRHPMPYGDLEQQIVQRFATWDDLDRYGCTIEEREEYEPYVEQGLIIYAGVDYGRIIAAAQAESDVLLWDGGNNDFSFLRPTLSIVVADALRPGHETQYYPGETNLRSADVVVINKVGSARPEDVAAVRRTVAEVRAQAVVLEADLELEVDRPELLSGRRVLVIEDGPTLTHGGMSYGAGTLAARRAGAAELVDPREHAVGSLARAFRDFPHLGAVLPALGYSAEQRSELAQTIAASGADVVVDASPCRIDRLFPVSLPLVRVRYRFRQVAGPSLLECVREAIRTLPRATGSGDTGG